MPVIVSPDQGRALSGNGYLGRMPLPGQDAASCCRPVRPAAGERPRRNAEEDAAVGDACAEQITGRGPDESGDGGEHEEDRAEQVDGRNGPRDVSAAHAPPCVTDFLDGKPAGDEEAYRAGARRVAGAATRPVPPPPWQSCAAGGQARFEPPSAPRPHASPATGEGHRPRSGPRRLCRLQSPTLPVKASRVPHGARLPLVIEALMIYPRGAGGRRQGPGEGDLALRRQSR